MTALSLPITARTSPISVDTALTVGSYGAPYTLGAENILIVGGNGTTQLSVERGQNGTAPAAHAAGTALTAGWGGSGGGVMAAATIQLSAAQISALHTAPVVIASPAAGTVLWPMSAVIVFRPGTTPWTEVPGEFTNIGWAGQSALGDAMLDQLVPQVLSIDCQKNFEGFYDLTAAETDIVITHGGHNPGGSGDGTAMVTVYYSVVTTS